VVTTFERVGVVDGDLVRELERWDFGGTDVLLDTRLTVASKERMATNSWKILRNATTDGWVYPCATWLVGAGADR